MVTYRIRTRYNLNDPDIVKTGMLQTNGLPLAWVSQSGEEITLTFECLVKVEYGEHGEITIKARTE